MINDAVIWISAAVLGIPVFYGLGGPLWVVNGLVNLKKLLSKTAEMETVESSTEPVIAPGIARSTAEPA
ncbi:MAG TPA: hypothetical protein VKY92_07855 [Verrucomicrobiae bacterium]|jgi:hypothetical protein|nr:hypothetical protein [Verrucomicrobiae bacterium]